MLRHESRTQPTPFPQTGNMTGFFFFWDTDILNSNLPKFCFNIKTHNWPGTVKPWGIHRTSELAKTSINCLFFFSVALLWYLLFDPTTWHSQSVRYVPLFYAPKPPPVVEYKQMSIFLLTTDKTVQQQKRHTRHFCADQWRHMTWSGQRPGVLTL